jgi:hypothetical protein
MAAKILASTPLDAERWYLAGPGMDRLKLVWFVGARIYCLRHLEGRILP